VVVLALVGQTAVPAFVGAIQRGPFLGVPSSWAQAADWLDAHPDGGRTLILPGGNAPARMWGEPKDEPLQPLASQPWIVRDAVPLGSAAATRILGEIEARVAQGRGGPELSSLLDTLAVTRVLLVGDQQRPNSRTTPPVVVRAALSASGARSVISFGDIVGGSAGLTTASDWGLDRPVRELELFEVDTSSTIAPTARVAVSSLSRYAGGPEGAASLRSVGGGIFTAEPGPVAAAASTVVTTDTLQRRQSSFATATDLYGPLLAGTEDYPSPRAVHDYWPDPLSEDTTDLTAQQTVRRDSGDARATASSTLAEPALGQGRELASDAWRAFDSSGETGWRSAGYDAKGQWVQVAWAAPTVLAKSLSLTLDTVSGANVAAVSVVTEAGTRRTPITSPALARDVDPARYPVVVEVPPGATRSLRLVIEAVRDTLPTVRVLDLGAGVLPRVEPSVRLPVTETSPDLVGLQASSDDRAACYALSSGVLACSPDRRRVGEEATTMRRLLSLETARSYVVSGTAGSFGEGADDLLRRFDGVRAKASSRWLPEPGVSPELAVDGDPKTYWASDPMDTTPTLTVTWPTARQVEGLRFAVDPDVAGRRPTEVDVTLGGRTVHRVLDRDGVVELPDRRARKLIVTVTATTNQDSLTATGARPMPLVIGEVALIGDPWPGAPTADAPVVVPCGFGPTVQVDGRTYPTTVTTTRGRVIERGDASLQVCGDVDLAAGEQRLQTLASGQFAVRSLVLDGRPTGGAPGAATPATPVQVQAWGNTARSVDLGGPSDVDTLLVVRENANPGWTARLRGTALQSVTVDGWAQGWVVPAGATGSVDLRFGPQRTFLVFLGVGAALALALAAMALLARRGANVEVLSEVVAPTATRVGAGAALVLVGGLTGLVVAILALLARGLRRRPAVGLVLAGGAAVAWLGWNLLHPWPAEGATNRDLASGALGLFLVGLATTWNSSLHGTRGVRVPGGRGRTAPGPRLDRGLEEVPAEGRDADRRRQGEDHGDPEAVGEHVQAQ
jgi:arabinofuranan 3-O-arabinosyltransferase